MQEVFQEDRQRHWQKTESKSRQPRPFSKSCGMGHEPLATSSKPTDNAIQDQTRERSQNTVLLASTQAVYKASHSTVRGAERSREAEAARQSGSQPVVIISSSSRSLRA